MDDKNALAHASTRLLDNERDSLTSAVRDKSTATFLLCLCVCDMVMNYQDPEINPKIIQCSRRQAATPM